MAIDRAIHIDRSSIVAGVGLAAIVVYFAALMHGLRAWPYSQWMVLLLVPILLAAGVAVIVRVTRDDDVPLTRLIVVALVVKLAASFVRYYVVFSLYGTGDSEQYDLAGTRIATQFRERRLSLTDLLAVGQGTRFVQDLTGVIYAFMGASRIGGFVVYSFVGFWGLFLFHRAALIGLPEGSQRRYALLVFFLPSLVFWPSSIGKEAVMMLSLGVCAWGAARILERRGGGGWLALAAGLGLGYMLRPHVAVVVLAALAVAMLFRRRRGRAPVLGPLGRIVTVILLMAAMAFVLGKTAERFLPLSEPTSPSGEVSQLLQRATSGTNEGGSEIDSPRPNSPLDYPYAAFTVLFRPTVLDVGSGGAALAAAETTFVLVLAVASWKRLRNLPSIAFRRPYVAFSIVYTGIFAFAWSSFGNLGAIARQRSQVWPFVLLLLAVPAAVGRRRSATAPAAVIGRAPGGPSTAAGRAAR
jgi:hypothetical protein